MQAPGGALELCGPSREPASRELTWLLRLVAHWVQFFLPGFRVPSMPQKLALLHLSRTDRDLASAWALDLPSPDSPRRHRHQALLLP